ncbi:MAG: carbon-nitrogen hydrolase family protein [Candidatus Omnitrophica bacterium]|nr:carbon-nitrogen hydrolase family protein [Candidatus Omnitrophota bacterium]
MKVALIQSKAGTQKEENIKRAVAFVRKAAQKKAEFILLPELFVYQGPDGAGAAEMIPGPTTRVFMKLAAEYGVYILCGSVYERVRGSKKVYNTAVLLNPKGNIQARYRKNHLFDAVIGRRVVKESQRFLAGKRGIIAKIKDFRVGLSICYDLRFPEFYRRYSKKGVDVLCVSSAFTHKTGKAHWEVLLRSRAVENLSYVLAPNQCGVDGKGMLNYGNSMVVSPWGEILVRASEKREGIAFAEIKKDVIQQKRKILPSFK